MGVSFQMSFSAVAGLVAFYDATRGWWKERHAQAGWLRRLGLYVLSIMATTVIATLATAPFALYHFQTLALYGVLGNILAMPVLTFVVMPLCVLAYGLMPFGAEGPVLQAVGWGVQAILDIAQGVSGMEHAVWRVPVFPVSAFVSFAAALVCLILMKGRLRAIALPLCVLSFLFIFQYKQYFILTSSDLNLIGYKEQSGSFYVTNLRKDKFTRGIWERSFGLEEGAAFKFPKEGREGDILCGEEGCRIERGEHKISILYRADDVPAECGWADVLFVQEPVLSAQRDLCEGVRIIDFYDARYKGVHGIKDGIKDGTRERGALRVEHAMEYRGLRPWVVSGRRASN